MKKFFIFISALFMFLAYGSAQNSSPYWSLAGNSNATSSSKLGTTNAINLRLFTNNAERMRINTSGLVGIGTTNPLTKLHVNGFGSFGNRVTTANATRALNLIDDNAVMRVLRVSTTAAPAVELISRTSADGANVAYWDFYAQQTDASFRIRDRQTGSNLDRLIITHADGNVGIGTTAPTYKLHVVGAAYGIYGSGTTFGTVGNSSDGYGVYGSSSTGYGVTGSSGYIGTYGSGNSYGLYGSGGTYGAYGSGNSYGVYGNSSSGYGVFGFSSSSYGSYGSSSSSWGSVAYGVYGAYGNGTSGYGVEGISSSNYGVYGYSSNSYGGNFYSSNSYGIRAGTGISSGFYAGVFDGSVYTFGTYQPSDASLKKNVQEFPDAMTIINKLRPVNYEYKSDGNFASLNLPKGNHYGLIAQELEKVLPNLVKDAPPLFANKNTANPIKPSPDGKPGSESEIQNAKNNTTETITSKAVNYTEQIPIIIKAMQEQDIEKDKKISDLQNQINELKSLIQALTKQGNNTTGLSTAFLKQKCSQSFQ